ncbi:hypothetical protein SSX86_010404 [Deinandra increscens subsp. villosa]|uniref:WRKY domain-containing protein n=1 Tax=Deinandra increscens subsp. villosa TaxID=3103831 RepID=A0AAP0H2H4_9ASTR
MESSSSWPESSPINRIKAIQELTQGQIYTNRLHEMIGQSETIESKLELVDHTLVISTSPNNWDDQTSEDSIESVKSMIPVKTRRGCYKRRKSCSELVNVTFNLVDDGYAWRKYGQKMILNSKHPRHYYRCSHKYEQGCLATKQVQMTEDEPPKYRITYHRRHTCRDLQISSPQIILDSPSPRDNSFLLSFETNELIKRKQFVSPFPSSTKR